MDKELLQRVLTCATKSGKRPWKQAVLAGKQLQSSLLKAAVDKPTRYGRTRARHRAFVALR